MNALAPAADGRRPSRAPGPRSIEVALPTFNSAGYLPALLDSLFAQTRQDFTILVADDGSSDATPDVLRAYVRKWPGRIRELAPGGGRRGVIGNFDRLIAHSRADYVFLCDHDDVWLPDKMERTLDAMSRLEAAHGRDTPLLVHTDLVVAGADLHVLAPSFFAYSRIDPRRNSPRELLLANVVTGCTTLVNRALYRRAAPIPQEAMMYDHWLALVAATTGALAYVDAPTILYRQHGANAIGAKRPSLARRVYGTLISRDRERVLTRYARQAEILLERFGSELAPRERAAAETLAHLWSLPRLRRFSALRRCGLGLEGLVRNVALFIVVLRAPRRSDGMAAEKERMVGPEGFEPPTKPL